MTIQVLVVDDVQAMAEQYAYDLKRVGKYDTIVAAGGEEALEVLAREPIDCVVLDLQMPMMTGVELQEHIARLADPPPVIIITPHDEPKTRERCLALGAVRYLRKPIEGEVLIESIEKAVRGRRRTLTERHGDGVVDRP